MCAASGEQGQAVENDACGDFGQQEVPGQRQGDPERFFIALAG
jgi:hypothetical protein